MADNIRALEPKVLWNNFADLNAIPRASKKEEQVIAFIKSFGEKLGLKTLVDSTGNVIIKKPASPGMEEKQIIVLQSHLDMVHQKNNDTNFDFNTEGIRMYIEGDWVKAEGTTLGSDNGIGVATIMSLLASKDIPHPPLEALFTIDEETGMTGAKGLQGGMLDAQIMLNLDTEDDDELTIGCAGGIDVTATGTYNQQVISGDYQALEIILRGLTGGHSGMDIQLGRGNANKLMNRFLLGASEITTLSINSIDGGGLRNAIPRESKAIIAIPKNDINAFNDFISQFNNMLGIEHGTTDPDAKLVSAELDTIGAVLDHDFQGRLLRGIYACPNGIYRMNPDIPGSVQTSNNIARVLVKDDQYTISCLCRSSSDSEKMDEVNAISSAFELIGATVKTSGEYPGWEPKPEARIVKIMSKLYQDMFGEEAHVSAVHAGLECGILGTNYPDMEMISFGPNIRGAHSPDEKCQISSVQKFWKFLLKTLENTP